MAAVLTEKKNPGAKYASAVDEQIAQATSRIRVHDLAFGGLLLVALVLVYTTAMILLDRYLILPEWVRQLGLLGLFAGGGATTYWTILRPLRRRVNPLYAAVQVEKTIEDAKNSVVGYVEAQEKGGVHPAVQAAMSARAAKSVGRADVNRAVDHRSLIYTGGAAVALLLTLVVLFFIFRPAQFASLVGRTFAPFTADPIANRTQLTLTEPTGGDVTITAGQSVTVKVQVGGKIPSPEKPDRVRVLLRHTQATPEYEELAMEKGENSREWQARVPDHLVRNGFWYKVAGGDAETPEYKVSVRSLPLFTEFEVAYEYPPYTRRKPEPPTKDPHLEAYRGTKVTVTGRTNRAVKDGRVVFEPPGRDPVVGKVPADRPDSVRFEFYLTASGTYRTYFTSAEGERNVDPPPFGIRVIDDEAPKIDVVKPEEDEIPVPANGQLAVDARVGDDFGIDRVTLKLRLTGAVPRDLAGKPYHDGKSFRRERDGTWPTALEYKDSVDLAQLKDPAGQKVEIKEGVVLEYWLEATDNRTRPGPAGPEPDPNVGRSRVKKVRVVAPVMPDQQEKLDARKQERQAEEKNHNQTQQKRLDTEPRDPTPKAGQPQPPEGAQGSEKEPKQPMGTPDPNPAKPPEMTEPKMPPEPKVGPEPMPPPEPKKGPDATKGPDQPPPNPMPMKGMEEPMMPPPGGMPMSEPGMGGTGQPQTAPMPSTPGQNQARSETQDQARRVEEQLNRDAEGGGPAKGGPPPENDRTNPGETKPPMPGGMESTDPPKEGPKPTDPANPMTGGSSPDTKPPGKPEKPEAPSDPKPDPGMMGQQGGAPQADTKNQKSGNPTGMDRETPKSEPNTPQDPAGGGAAKPATEQKTPPEGSSPPMPNPAEDAGKPKPMPKNDPGTDREPAGDPMGGTSPDSGGKPEGGATKPRSMPESTSKPAPNETTPMPGSGDPMGEPKPAPQDNGGGDPMNPGSASTKPDKTAPKNPPMGGTGGGTPEKGLDKPKPDQQSGGGGSDQTPPKTPDQGTKGSNGGQRKLDPKQEQEIKDALNDLTSKDADKRKAAQDKLDKMVGKENRKEIEDIANGLNSDDKDKRAAAEQKLNDLKEQMKKDGQDTKNGGNTAQQSKPDPKEVEKAINDLKSPDQKTRDAAKEKLDDTFGKGAGQKAENDTKDLQSGDQAKQDAAQERLNDLKKQADQMAKAGGAEPKKGPNENAGGAGKKIDPKEVEKAVKDLQSPDQKTRDAAKEKLDDTFGKGAGQKAEDFLKDLKSDDPKTRDAAQKKLDDLKKQADQMAKAGGAEPKKGPNENTGGAGKKPDPKEVEKAVNDLQSPDQKTRDAAKEKLDDTFGKGAGQAAEDLARDLQSNDPKTRDAAQKKLDDLKKQADQMAKNNPGEPKKGQGPSGDNPKVDPKEVEKALDALNDQDPKKRQAAKEKLDEMLGKGAGQKAEENNKKANSGTLEEQAKARQERDEMIKKAEEMARKGQDPSRGKELTPEELADLAKKADDLNSKDETKRRDAEKELDQKLGKENREKLQEAMKNQPNPTPQQAEDMRKQLDEMAKKAAGAASDKPDGNRVPKGPPGSSDVQLKEAMKDDARNRAKSAELQLEKFEKNKHNKDLLDRLGMKEQDYQKFLDAWQNEVARLKQEADDLEKAGPMTTPAGSPTGNVSEARKVESRAGTSGSATGAGALFAAPGYADAMKKFQEGAAKVRGKQP